MITIKGLRDGLLIIFGEEPWMTQVYELERKLEANSHFFKGGRIALDVKSLTLTIDDLKRIISLLTQYEVTIWAVLAQDETTRTKINKLGLASTIATPEKAAVESEEYVTNNSGVEGTDGLLVHKRVRSGQVLRHPGHIVVIGDVNPGAQLIAGGDIIVWGKLQGMAHAGALGDSNAVICALELTPNLLKIADAARSSVSVLKREHNKRPEMAKIDLQEIRIVSWQEK